jgi:hypothetical protein
MISTSFVLSLILHALNPTFMTNNGIHSPPVLTHFLVFLNQLHGTQYFVEVIVKLDHYAVLPDDLRRIEGTSMKRLRYARRKFTFTSV